jgi:two-component system, sensor histidine kinase LadS
MKPLLRHIIFSIIFFKVGFVEAQEIQIGNNFHHILIGNRVEIFEDKSKKMNFGEVKNQQFSTYPKQSINVGFTNSYYWLRFRLKNTDSVRTSAFLEISNPHINKLQLFVVKGNEVSKSMLTGDHFPFTQRPYNHAHFVFPIILKPYESSEYYLWIDKHGEQLQIPIELWNEKDFADYSEKLSLFVGLTLGITSVWVIISLLMFWFFRQFITLYYWLYTTAVWTFLVAHSGFGFKYIWQNATWWTSSARPISAMLFYMFSILFARQFFTIKKGNRFLDILTKSLITLLSTLLILSFLKSPLWGLKENYWYNPNYYEGNDLLIFMKTLNLTVLVVLWGIIGIGIYDYAKTRKAESLWFTFGFSMLLVSGTLTIFIFIGLVPDNYLTQNFPLIANPLEIIILSFLLANRYKNIHTDNAKISAELAEQRQQNAIQLLEGQMIERRRLSQELHDGISLMLANIRLRLSMLSEKYASVEINDLVEKIGDVGQDVRQFSHALSPVLLEKNGLIEAIEELIQTTQSNQAKLKFVFLHDEIDEHSLNSLLKQTIYQIILELINNTVRHANASEIKISLHQNTNHLILEVSDNGIGYELQHKQKGIGLQNIKARTQSLYGKFQIKRLEIGMKHLVEIPIQTKLFS